jgi:hypothetical protein
MIKELKQDTYDADSMAWILGYYKQLKFSTQAGRDISEHNLWNNLVLRLSRDFKELEANTMIDLLYIIFDHSWRLALPQILHIDSHISK